MELRTKDKTLLFTTENVNWGGSELLWSKCAELLATKGFNVVVLVPEELRDEVSQLCKEIQVIYFSKANLHLVKRILNRFLTYKNRFKPVSKRIKTIENISPDLLIINQGYNFNGIGLMNYAIMKNINYVTISHAVNEGLWPSEEMRNSMKIGFQNSLANYFVSKDNLEVTSSQLCCSLKNATVVRNPFNVPYNSDISYPEYNNEYRIACVGRYDFFAKGQDILLRVMSSSKWRERNLIVNFYGSGRDIQNITDFKNYHNMNNIVIHDYIETINIWKHNQALILSSRFEGLPISIVEAMLCKRMVITTDVSGNAEVLTDGKNSFIAEAPRVKYLDNALEKAWSKRDDWEAMGEQANRDIIQFVPEFPEQVFAEKLLELIK